MNPISAEKAWTTREKLSVLYAIIAWHALALVGYQVYHGNKSWPKTMGIDTNEGPDLRPAVQYSYLLGVRKAQVYRISGFRISEAEHIALTDQAAQRLETPTINSEVNES